MAKPAAKAALAAIERTADALSRQMGYELVEAALEKEPAGLYLRFYLDKEGGISLDDCEAYHRALQPLLEQYDYDFMEVCSPGIDRPIKTERDALRCMGEQVEVRLYKPMDGQKAFTGALTAFANGDITLDIAGETRVFLKKDIAVAKCVVDLTGIEDADIT